jgi:4-alpha-glucanotransferase
MRRRKTAYTQTHNTYTRDRVRYLSWHDREPAARALTNHHDIITTFDTIITHRYSASRHAQENQLLRVCFIHTHIHLVSLSAYIHLSLSEWTHSSTSLNTCAPPKHSQLHSKIQHCNGIFGLHCTMSSQSH